MSYKDTILQQTSEAAIYGHYVPSSKGKPGTYTSPFKPDEKTPGFSIYQNGAGLKWKNYSAGDERQGDVWQLVAELKGLDCKKDFTEVCQVIAADMRLSLPEQPEPGAKIFEPTTLPEFTPDFITYWARWKVTPELLTRYGVNQVASLKNNASEAKGLKAGWDYRNKAAALFTGGSATAQKIIVPSDPATGQKTKQVYNSPDSAAVYIFGIEQAEAARPETLIICEGEKDALVLAANGFNAVSFGSANARPRAAQVERIKAIGSNVFICYDTDEAGRKGAAKIQQLTGFPVVQLPSMEPGKNDVADYFSEGHSAADFSALLEAATIDQSAGNKAGEKEKGTAAIDINNDAAGSTDTNNHPAEPKRPLTKFAQVEEWLNNLYDFRFNEVSNEVEYKTKDAEAFTPCNARNIYRQLQLNGINFSQASLDALLGSDFVQVYNPFEHYFNNLEPYDPTREPDYITETCTYVTAKDQERFNRQFRKMLVRIIACALEPATFNKQAFVLVHNVQNSGKSTFCRWLCPPALSSYYTETFSADKDGQIALSTMLIINLDELATLAKQELNQLKSLFSKDAINIRRPYDKKATATPRRASFLGSTNDREFLTDLTGSVRWLCFEIEKINWAYKTAIDINRLYAQAFHIYRTGFKYQLTPDEIQENEAANEEHRQSTIELDFVSKYCRPGNTFYLHGEIVSNLQAFTHVRLNSKAISQALAYLGFEKKKNAGKTPQEQRLGYWLTPFTSNTY